MLKKLTVGIISLMIIVFMSINAYSEKKSSVKGLVIYTSEELIEVKRGWNEYELIIQNDTEVFYKGEKASVHDIEICQNVTAYFTEEDGKKLLIRVDIRTSSYCYR